MNQTAPSAEFESTSMIVGVGFNTAKRIRQFKIETHPPAVRNYLESFSLRCAFCGFACGDYVSLAAKNDDYSASLASNLSPACPFCFAAKNMDLVEDRSHGQLVYFPEVSQALINRGLRSLFVKSSLGDSTAKEIGKRVFASFRARATVVESSWGSSDPVVFSKALRCLNHTTYEEIREKLCSLRFVPTPSCTLIGPQYIDYLGGQAKKADPNGSNVEELIYSLVLREHG